MVNRRLARPNRLKQKKKEKAAKKEVTTHDGENEETSFSPISVNVKKNPLQNRKIKQKKSKQRVMGSMVQQITKKKTELLKRQAMERMVLKERLRELTEKKNRMRKGENVKAERRELGKYIRQLREQLLKKHADDVAAVKKELEAVIMQPKRGRRTRSLLVPGIPATLYRHQDGAFVDNDSDWVDCDDDDDGDDWQEKEVIGEEEIREMFSHLTA